MASPVLGLRVDVDTHEGMRDGVPCLLDLFARAGVHASIYLSLGPDRAGLAVLNVLRRPGFLRKMLRTRAVRVYGLRTVLSGTLLPARPIALAFPEIARRARQQDHELGVHAWDHRAWQDRLLRWPPARIVAELDRARAAFHRILGDDPRTFAAPAWLTCDDALLHQETFGLEHASDCRGREPFLPVVGGRVLETPQVPDTLTTLDEALGDTHEDADGFFADVLDRVAAQRSSVLTVHAELEGGPYAEPFLRFLEEARRRGIEPMPLAGVLERHRAERPLQPSPMIHGPVRGRHGVLSMQGAPAGA